MKDFTSSKEAQIIFRSMEARTFELWNKLLNKDYNAATMFAFQLGFISDIDEALEALKVKRTSIKKYEVKELEVVDAGNEIELIENELD